MKRTITILLAISGLLAGLPLFFSLKTEEAYQTFLDHARQNNTVLINKYDYLRGYLGSTAYSTATINWDKLLGDQANKIDATTRSLGYKISHEIKHGPFPEIMQGNFRPAQALITTRLGLSDNSKAKFSGLFPEEHPVTFHTWVDLTGGSKTLISAAPFHTRSQTGTLVWKGLSGELSTTPERGGIISKLEVPQFSFQSSADTTYHLRGLLMTSNTSESGSGIRVGDVEFILDELVIKSADNKTSNLRIRQLAVKSRAYNTQQRLGSSTSLSVRELAVNGQQFGPATYDVSINKLPIPLIKQIQKELETIRLSGLPDQEKKLALTDKAHSWFTQLLEHEPELDINQLRFYFDEKQCSVSAQARVNASLLTRNAPLLLLLQAFDIKANITIPKSLLAAMPAPKPRLALSADNKVMQSQVIPTATQRMDRLVQQGFFTTDGHYYRTELIYKQGKLSLNGQPFNPLQLVQ